MTGRMVLLVTTLLSLVTMFDTVRNNSPDALELKSIEVKLLLLYYQCDNRKEINFNFLFNEFKVWLLCCTFFVFLALMEYFVVLFGIRYDSHWRRSQMVAQSNATSGIMNPKASPAPSRINLSNQNLQVPPSSIANALPSVETPVMKYIFHSFTFYVLIYRMLIGEAKEIYGNKLKI
jgi:hypothetical protein